MIAPVRSRDVWQALFPELLEDCASRHAHLCPRQVLGLRMGLLGGHLLRLEVPQTGKRLLTFVETDGCAADGVSVATGCTVGPHPARDRFRQSGRDVCRRASRRDRIAPRPGIRRPRPLRAGANSRWRLADRLQIMPDGDAAGVSPVPESLIEALLSRRIQNELWGVVRKSSAGVVVSTGCCARRARAPYYHRSFPIVFLSLIFWAYSARRSLCA
jgi:formylmethanofuran dehydrogenase subunit E